MLWYMIKNNVKLIFRNKILVISVLIAPVAIIAILSGAFKELLSTYEMKDTITIAYSVSEDSPYAPYMEQLSKISVGDQILFMNDQKGKEEIKTILNKNKYHAFLEINQSTYTLTLSDTHKYENGLIENIVSKVIDQILKRPFMDDEIIKNVYCNLTDIEVTPMASSLDYYGIVEITYFAMCGVVVISMVVNSEKKNRIGRRMQAAGVTKLNMYLSKLIPCSIGVFIEMLGAAILSNILLGNQYGNIPSSIGILFLLSIASSAFGIASLYIVKGIAGGIIIVFGLTWLMSFCGGAFENYMMSDIPKVFVNSSVMYYINRTLVEFRTMGESKFVIPCVFALLIMTTICSLISMIFIKKGAVE